MIKLEALKNIVESSVRNGGNRGSKYDDILNDVIIEVKSILKEYGEEGKNYLLRIKTPAQAVRLFDLAFSYKKRVKEVNPKLKVLASPLYTLTRKYSNGESMQFADTWADFVEAMWKEVNPS